MPVSAQQKAHAFRCLPETTPGASAEGDAANLWAAWASLPGALKERLRAPREVWGLRGSLAGVKERHADIFFTFCHRCCPCSPSPLRMVPSCHPDPTKHTRCLSAASCHGHLADAQMVPAAWSPTHPNPCFPGLANICTVCNLQQNPMSILSLEIHSHSQSLVS